MNDISEVRHGVDAIYNAFNGEAGAERLRLIRAAAPYFANILESFYRSGEADKAIGESYVMSLTSHLPRESHLGRLSMWRAYGGASGVALIFNSKAFLSSSQNPGIFSGVVNYLSPPQLVAELDGIIDRLRQYKEELDLIDPHLQDNYFKMIIAAASIFVKHEGFKEEREYRVFSSPLVRGGGLVSYDTAIIRGIPQRVIKIPLAKVIEGSNQSSILNDLLEGVIIGPTVSPQQIKEALSDELHKSGVEDAVEKVTVSSIPYRSPL